MSELQKQAWAALDKNREAMLAERRNAALEDAARACEAEYADTNWHPYYRAAASNCAYAIRALKTLPSEGTPK